MARDQEPMYSLLMVSLEALEVYNAFKERQLSESVLFSRVKGVQRLANNATSEMMKLLNLDEDETETQDEDEGDKE